MILFSGTIHIKKAVNFTKLIYLYSYSIPKQDTNVIFFGLTLRYSHGVDELFYGTLKIAEKCFLNKMYNMISVKLKRGDGTFRI